MFKPDKICQFVLYMLLLQRIYILYQYHSEMLVILDFDGTIADTQSLIVKTMQQTMKELGMEVMPRENCAKTIGLRLEEGFQLLYKIPYDEAVRCAATYRKIFEENKKKMVVEPFPHVIETIKQMIKDKHVVAIASSRSRASLLEYVRQMHIENCISCIVAANDVEKVKPAPEMVMKVMKEVNGNPEDTIVVGDMTYDIEMGKNAGTKTCGVTYGNGTPEQLLAADYVIDDFAELIALINNDKHLSDRFSR